MTTKCIHHLVVCNEEDQLFFIITKKLVVLKYMQKIVCYFLLLKLYIDMQRRLKSVPL